MGERFSGLQQDLCHTASIQNFVQKLTLQLLDPLEYFRENITISQNRQFDTTIKIHISQFLCDVIFFKNVFIFASDISLY